MCKNVNYDFNKQNYAVEIGKKWEIFFFYGKVVLTMNCPNSIESQTTKVLLNVKKKIYFFYFEEKLKKSRIPDVGVICC